MPETRRPPRSATGAAGAQIDEGVTIGIDENRNARVSQKVAGGTADVPGADSAPGTVAVADGLDDPRLRDLRETMRLFMAASGAAGPATARLAAVLLSLTAKDAGPAELIAGVSLEALRARLRGESRPETALPRSLVAVLDQAADTWRATSDADFWPAMAAAAARPGGISPEQHLHEQAACLGVVAELGKADVKPRWVWATAAEKADLVDVLIIAGTGAAEPARAVVDRVGTLTRGPDRLPRAIAAELAQMALAALAGVTKAPPPDRRGAVLLRERPPRPDATPREVAAHRAREALRSTAHALLVLDDGNPDRLAARLFRSRLSTLYLDMCEQLRQYAPRSDDDLPGETRYRRLLEVLGPLDRALVESLDRWSAVIATGSTDAQRYVEAARGARVAIEAVLRRMGRATASGDPTRPLFPTVSPEQIRVAVAVRMIAVELGLEAGEVLLGRVAQPGDPLAGVRQRLAELREDRKRLKSEQNARMGGPLLATLALRPKYLGALNGPTVKALTAAATAFDTAASAPDPDALATAADHLIAVAHQARTAGAAMREWDRQEVVQLTDLLQEIVADRLEGWPGPLSAKATALRATTPTLPLPATGESLVRFWGDRKAEALAELPPEMGAQVRAAMTLHLGAELARMTALAAGDDDTATEEQAWRVIRILRAYKATASRLPVSRADVRARLHAVLDAVALSVQQLLPPPTTGG